MNIAAIARATRETTQETTPGPDGESSDARSAQLERAGRRIYKTLQNRKTTRTQAMLAIFC
jgi:hypothetical protein